MHRQGRGIRARQRFFNPWGSKPWPYIIHLYACSAHACKMLAQSGVHRGWMPNFRNKEHEQCKACAESCAECQKECKKFVT
jgi:hypothetical protein